MKKKVSVIISLFLCVFVLASCSGGAPSSASYSESDFMAVYGAVGDIEVDPSVDKSDSDSVQMADSIRSTFITAMLDPIVIEKESWVPTASSDYKDIRTVPNCEFRTAVEEILGTSLDDIKTKSGSKVLYRVGEEGYSVVVVIAKVD